MMDDLVKRLASWGTAAGLGTHFLGTKSAREDCAEAAATLSEAQATIARQQVVLDRALEDAGDKMVEVARLREALRPFAQEHAWGPDDRFEIVLAGPYGSITGADLDRACAALEAKHG